MELLLACEAWTEQLEAENAPCYAKPQHNTAQKIPNKELTPDIQLISINWTLWLKKKLFKDLDLPRGFGRGLIFCVGIISISETDSLLQSEELRMKHITTIVQGVCINICMCTQVTVWVKVL